MHSHHSIFVALLLLLLSPLLLCSHNEAKIKNGKPIKNDEDKIKQYQAVVTVLVRCDASSIIDTFCGGTAISPNAVVTTKTCVNQTCDGKKTINISADYRQQTGDSPLLYTVADDQISLYNTTGVDPDIALLFVGRPLPHYSEVLDHLPGGEDIVASFAGWSDDGNTIQEYLQFALAKEVDQSKCDLNKPKGEGSKWTCVAGEDKSGGSQVIGPCLGDYGGPVFVEVGNVKNLTLFAIIIPSKMDYCNVGTAEIGFPALQIGYYLDWIYMEQVKYPLQTMPAPVIWKPANSTHNNTGPSTGTLFFSPFLLGLLTLVQFFLL